MAIPKAVLTVKLHPSDRSGIAEAIAQGKGRVMVVHDSVLPDLLRAADVAIVTSSTTGLEACVLDCPLVEFNPTGSGSIVDYHHFGAALLVEDDADLESAIRAALSDQEVRSALAAGRRLLVDELLDGALEDAVNRAAAEILHEVGNLAT